MIRLIVFVLFIKSGYGLYFKCADEVIPYHKEKLGLTDVYEDRSGATRNLLVVADGIGGSHFPSGVFAQSLVFKLIQRFYKKQEQKLDPSKIQQSIAYAISNYNTWSSNINSTSKGINLSSQETETSSTFVGISLEFDTAEWYYNFFQLGDSLGTIYSLQTGQNNNSYYLPRFISEEQQSFFNCPYQIGNKDGTGVLSNMFFQKINTIMNDIVVVGSDGLYDNIAGPIMAILTNLIVKINSQVSDSSVNEDYLVDKFSDDLFDFMRDRGNMANYYKSKYVPTQEEIIAAANKPKESSISVFNLICMGGKSKAKKEVSPIVSFNFHDMRNYALDPNALNGYINSVIENMTVDSQNINDIGLNLFELLGCEIRDYMEFIPGTNNELSECVKAVLFNMTFPSNLKDYFNPQFFSRIMSKVVKAIMEKGNDTLNEDKVVIKKGRDILIPFNIKALQSSLKFDDFHSKNDDIGISVGIVFDDSEIELPSVENEINELQARANADSRELKEKVREAVINKKYITITDRNLQMLQNQPAYRMNFII